MPERAWQDPYGNILAAKYIKYILLLKILLNLTSEAGEATYDKNLPVTLAGSAAI